jgi:hypothetical protein
VLSVSYVSRQNLCYLHPRLTLLSPQGGAHHHGVGIPAVPHGGLWRGGKGTNVQEEGRLVVVAAAHRVVIIRGGGDVGVIVVLLFLVITLLPLFNVVILFVIFIVRDVIT